MADTINSKPAQSNNNNGKSATLRSNNGIFSSSSTTTTATAADPLTPGPYERLKIGPADAVEVDRNAWLNLSVQGRRELLQSIKGASESYRDIRVGIESRHISWVKTVQKAHDKEMRDLDTATQKHARELKKDGLKRRKTLDKGSRKPKEVIEREALRQAQSKVETTKSDLQQLHAQDDLNLRRSALLHSAMADLWRTSMSKTLQLEAWLTDHRHANAWSNVSMGGQLTSAHLDAFCLQFAHDMRVIVENLAGDLGELPLPARVNVEVGDRVLSPAKSDTEQKRMDRRSVRYESGSEYPILGEEGENDDDVFGAGGPVSNATTGYGKTGTGDQRQGKARAMSDIPPPSASEALAEVSNTMSTLTKSLSRQNTWLEDLVRWADEEEEEEEEEREDERRAREEMEAEEEERRRAKEDEEEEEL